MSTAGSQAGLETFDALEIEYEHAYGNNPFKIAAVKKAISLVPVDAKVLDVGCGTGVPVSKMLYEAGLNVHGCDISPKMIEHARSRVTGNFTVADYLEYKPKGSFAAVFMIFCHLQLSYASFHSAVWKFANALDIGGLFVLGQMPSEKYVKEESAYDETKSYVEDYDAPFMGKPEPTLMMTQEGQKEMFRSMGFVIMYETIDDFQPENEKCEPEEQQYLIARRVTTGRLSPPQPFPRAFDLITESRRLL